MKFYTFDDYRLIQNNNNSVIRENTSEFETAIGVGIGYKWVSKNGFLIDIGLGAGRDLGLAENDNSNKAVVQLTGGVNFGYRF